MPVRLVQKKWLLSIAFSTLTTAAAYQHMARARAKADRAPGCARPWWSQHLATCSMEPKHVPPPNDDNDESLSATLRHQANEVYEKSVASLLVLQDQAVRHLLDALPAKIIDNAAQLNADQLRDAVSRLWDTFTFNDLLDAVTDSKDPAANPEMLLDAHVRQGSQLCPDEIAFVQRRKEFQRDAFAKFIGVDPAIVEPEDIPIIGIASSGGGYRAMLGLTGYLKGMKDSSFLDCVMYTAGVSGSCWALALYNNVLTKGDVDVMIDELKARVGSHFANVSKVYSLASASPENAKLMLQGVLQRYVQQDTVSLVDLFGMLIGNKLFTTRGNTEHPLAKAQMKLSSQRQFSEDGTQPMPIYCVVHQDLEKRLREEEEKANKGGGTALNNDDYSKAAAITKINQLMFSAPAQSSGFEYMWFEFTPYEVGSNEIDAWIPTWAMGRVFEHGVNTERLPEQRLDSLLGVFGSAFTATVVHFYKEIRGLLPSSSVRILDDTIDKYQTSLVAYYPISPATYANPFYHLDPELGTRPRPSFVTESKRLYLMDAGMDNNIPFHCFLARRDVDVIVAIDLSADINTAPHFDRAEGYVKRHGIEGWPADARWPKKEDEQWIDPYGLGTCTVFPATEATTSIRHHHPPEQHGQKKMDTDDSDGDDELVVQHVRHLSLLYFPFIVNKQHDPEFDPQTADFCATWNFVYQPEQVERVVRLGQANWDDNIDTVRKVLYATWIRKMRIRMQLEALAAVEDPF
ncbi:acyl transferase/acyl hydrolase/lysophospholipase [Gongronella butleri]|nr:acyl transferase/acyl hydrolase/lysophospholipase [Gongronella butleri]